MWLITRLRARTVMDAPKRIFFGFFFLSSSFVKQDFGTADFFLHHVIWLYRSNGIQEMKPAAFFIIFLVLPSFSLNKEAHSRQKRILWVTADGRLALPPGTTMIITPSLSLPFVRYPPEGFFSNMTVSLPFTIDFNKLGLTDNENPFGALPPVLARSMGRAAGGVLADYVGSLFDHRKRSRSRRSVAPEPPKELQHVFHGGERALLFVLVEDFLENFGMDGKACLLRAICEVHAHPMTNFGLVGEMMKLFLSASKSQFSEIMSDYVEAEKAGRGGAGGPSECWPYMKDCPKSLFEPKHSHYTNYDEEDKSDNKVTYDPTMQNM